MAKSSATQMSKSAKRRSKNKNNTGASGMVVSRPFTAMFDHTTPGHASVRVAFEALNGSRAFDFCAVGTSGFNAWAPRIQSLLTPFAYFRITSVRLTTQVTGGAASVYTVVANLSNNAMSFDNSATAILDDEYAGVANATQPLIIQPPRGYWQMTPSTWYPATTASLDAIDVSQGSMSLYGYGGADASTVLGWHTVDVDIEFHTLR